MTTQIIVANKYGIAVASDSILTLTTPQGKKTLPNSKKIIELGKNHKILVLSSGDADINDLPSDLYLTKWAETLIEPLPTVEAYLTSFVTWLGENCSNLDPRQGTRISDRIADFLNLIASNFRATMVDDVPDPWEIPELESWVASNPAEAKIYVKNLKRAIEEAILSAGNAWEYPFISQDSARKLIDPVIAEEMVSTWFPGKEVTPTLKQKLVNSFSNVLARRVNPLTVTQLMFVGYGSNSLTGSLNQLNVEIVMPGMVQAWVYSRTEAVEGATINFPAQRSAVRSFLNGYDDDLKRKLATFVSDAIRAHLNPTLDGNNEPLSPKKERDIAETVSAVAASLEQKLENYGSSHYDELMNTLEAMDVSSLIEVAETLAGMQILAEHNSKDVPTSGGTIELATIDLSKGVTWLRRVGSNHTLGH